MPQQTSVLEPELQRAWDAFHRNPKHAEVGDPLPIYNPDSWSDRETLAGIKRVLDAQEATRAA